MSAASGAEAQTNEFRQHWPILLCALLGSSAPSISIYALGQFMAPLETEFSWTRSQATAGLSLSLVLGFLLSPVVGRMADKLNARWLAIPGLILVGIAIAAFSLATESLSLWIGLWAFQSGVGALVGPTVWLSVVSFVFDKYRSLAIAIALCGNNMSTAFGPPVARFLLDEFGWRMSFQLLALLWVGPALILSLLFFFDRRPRGKARGSEQGTDEPRPEVALKPVFLSGTFVRLALAMTLITVIGSAYSIHLSPALAEKGLTLAGAATVAMVAGLTAVPGKLFAGSLFDRHGPSRMALLIMALLALACVLFALRSNSVALAITASAIFGLASGANMALVTVIVARYFDARVFGVVFGVVMSLTALAAAIGPLAISVIYDSAGSYAPAFWAGVPIALIAAVLMQRLRPVAAG